MNLRPQERSLLYASYLEIAAAGSELTTLFYNRLFELNPSFRLLFKTPIQDQGIKWRMMLNIILVAIDEPARLKKSLREMGQRHASYGVKTEDYFLFTEAVLWAIQKYLSTRFTPEIETIWRKLFAFIVEEATSA